MLCKPSLHDCWGLDSKPCGCVTILGKMEDEPHECPTVEDGSCMGVTIWDDPVCMGTAVLGDGSRERVPPSWNWAMWSAKGCLQIMGCVLRLRGHCTSQVLCATGSDRDCSGSEGCELGPKDL